MSSLFSSDAPTTYSASEAYKNFRAWVAQQKRTIETPTPKVWKFYDYGNKDMAPLVCFPGVSGSAECFYRLFVTLVPRGYRIISIQYPSYSTHGDFVKGFDKFLDSLGLQKVHLFGTGLGGYLSLCYGQYRPSRISSILLCNTFVDTQYFKDRALIAPMFSFMPKIVLQKILLANFPTQTLESEIANSVDFMVEQLELLSQDELSSRLILNCSESYLRPSTLRIDNSLITIMDTLDEQAVPEKLREEVYKYFPEAKIAHIKTGGNFPYLSRADEFNMHVQVHLRGHGVNPNSQEDDDGNAAQPISTQPASSAKAEDSDGEEEAEPLQVKSREPVSPTTSSSKPSTSAAASTASKKQTVQAEKTEFPDTETTTEKKEPEKKQQDDEEEVVTF